MVVRFTSLFSILFIATSALATPTFSSLGEFEEWLKKEEKVMMEEAREVDELTATKTFMCDNKKGTRSWLVARSNSGERLTIRERFALDYTSNLTCAQSTLELNNKKSKIEAKMRSIITISDAFMADQKRLNNLPNPTIGMSKESVVNKTRWGKPKSKFVSVTNDHEFEIWEYSDGRTLNFVDGELSGATFYSK